VPTAAGSYAVVAVVDDVNYRGRTTGTLEISKASATVSLGGLEAVFDGTPKAASVTTVPAGLPVVLTYDGSPTAPTALGSYAVVATINDINYQGTVSDIFVIGEVSATGPRDVVSNLSVDMNPKALTITGLTGDNKPFDGNTSARARGNAALSGVVGADDVSLTGTPVFTFASANAGTGIAITTTGYSLAGADAGKYTLAQPSLSASIVEDPLFAHPGNAPRIAWLPNGGVRLSFQGLPGRTYSVQRSTTLLAGSWTQISTVTAGEDSQVNFVDPDAPANSAFYRVGIPAQ
jgi:hypothetical protein